MIRLKVCMLGAFAVGKTSLVRRFVHSRFDETYHTTIGTKVDRRELVVDGQDVHLLLWDMVGEDELQRTRTAYLRGLSGALYVVDSTRQATLDVALDVHRRVLTAEGDVPGVLVLNKLDLPERWDLDDARLDELVASGWTVVRSSAKTGEGVEAVFAELAARMMPRGRV